MADPAIIAAAKAMIEGTTLDLADATHELENLYQNAYATGVQTGLAALDQPSDWSTWEPGYGEAAAQAWGTDGGRGLQALLDNAGVTIKSVADNRMDELADVLGQALDEGWGSDELARELRSVLDKPDRAEMVARTESARAMTTASMDEYHQAGVTGKEWLLSDGACPECEENEAEGVIPLDDDWPNGDVPVHPNCVCAVAPASLPE